MRPRPYGDSPVGSLAARGAGLRLLAVPNPYMASAVVDFDTTFETLFDVIRWLSLGR